MKTPAEAEVALFFFKLNLQMIIVLSSTLEILLDVFAISFK